MIGPNSRHTSTRRRQHEPSNNGLSARMTVTAYHAFLSFPSRQTKREEKSLIPLSSPLFAIGPQNALVPGYSCVLTVNTLPSLSPSPREMASTKGAIIHPCPPATPQSAESAAVHWRIPHLLLLGAEGEKIKGIAMGPHQIKARRRRWAIKASLPLSPLLHDVYLSLCRARRASNGMLSRPLSLAHGGPPIRVGNDLQSCTAKWRFGSERASGLASSRDR